MKFKAKHVYNYRCRQIYIINCLQCISTFYLRQFNFSYFIHIVNYETFITDEIYIYFYGW